MIYARAFLAYLFLCSTAFAQVGQIPSWPPIQVVASGGSYTGPGDIIAGAAAWGGMRAYSAAYATSLGKIANICTPSDAVCADVNSDSSGNFNLAGTPSLTCNNVGSICTVKTLYDQTGNTNCSSTACDFVQPTIAIRPILVISASGGRPAMRFQGGSAQLTIAVGHTITTMAQPFWISAVGGKRTAGTTTLTSFLVGGTNAGLLFSNSANTIAVAAGSLGTATAADAAYHSVQGLINSSSSSVYVDTTTTSSLNPGTNNMSGQSLIIGNFSGSGLTGDIFEVGVWAGNQSASNVAMGLNQHGTNGYSF